MIAANDIALFIFRLACIVVSVVLAIVTKHFRQIASEMLININGRDERRYRFLHDKGIYVLSAIYGFSLSS